MIHLRTTVEPPSNHLRTSNEPATRYYRVIIAL